MKKEISPKQLLWALKIKRRRMAKREDLENKLFLVFQNSTLEEIVAVRPEDKDDLRKIKGFGEKKIEKYGEEILRFIKNPLMELKREKRNKKIRLLYPKLMRTKLKLSKKSTFPELIFKTYLDELGIKYLFQKSMTTNNEVLKESEKVKAIIKEVFNKRYKQKQKR